VAPSFARGNDDIQSVIEIPVPVIATINGPVHRHPELPLMSYIVLATPDNVFQDECHLPQGLLPGDGMHVVMPMPMGRVRGSYLVLTGQILEAADGRPWVWSTRSSSAAA
jgi:enoyl-CoA hydratase/carnithine racemase